MPYRPDITGDRPAAAVCKGNCNNPSMHATKGQFSTQQITSVWRAQQQIRRNGAVVSRYDVYSDFESFFADKHNVQVVYRPADSADLMYYHAITRVGYDNVQQYWLANNSYGNTWGDGGLFKVAYGVCAILSADNGEVYGITWTPNGIPDALQLPMLPGPRANCYNARAGDYLSKVAWLAGIDLEKFMVDNTASVKDLDSPLQGTQLLLCNPRQGNVKISATSSAVGPTTTAGPAGPSVDDQLEALLRVKSAIEQMQELKEWNRANGIGGSYCKWRGVHCIPGTATVHKTDFEAEQPKAGEAVKWTESLVFKFKGTLPTAAAFDGLSGLTNITLDMLSITIRGTLPADWSPLTNLQSIHIRAPMVTGSLPPSWSNLTSLKRLKIWASLQGPVPPTFVQLTSLEELGIGDGMISPIPDLSPLSKLQRLALNQGRFGGTLPTWLPNLKSLEDLPMFGCGFKGTIPTWLGTMHNLKSMRISDNRFTGSISSSLGSLNKLAVLDIGRGQGAYGAGDEKLSGTLPDAFKALTKWQELRLNGHALVGTVPASWSGLRSLKEVHLYDNSQLQGCVPAFWRTQLTGLGPWYNGPYKVEERVLKGNKLGYC